MEGAFGELISKYKWPLLLAVVGVLFVGLGFFNPSLSLKNSSEKKVVVTNQSNNISNQIKVDISGAVKNPGLYSLNSEARVQDAIAAAGGFSQQADSQWVSKNINLAQKLGDGEKVYIASVGEALGTSTTQTANGKVNINTSNEADLDSLPNIGPVTAKKIIAGRPYQQIDDLLNKKIVGASTYSKIKDLISVN